MFTTIDVHVHVDDTTVAVNETGTGIVLHDVGSVDPRLNLFLGTTKREILANIDLLHDALYALRDQVTT